MKKKKDEKVIELTKGKPRPAEEKFFSRFSETQLTVVLLIILASTFLTQGVLRYFEIMGKTGLLKPWFTLILLTIIFLVISGVSISLGGVTSPLRFKRKINLISFSAFILGFVLFLAALVFLLFVI